MKQSNGAPAPGFPANPRPGVLPGPRPVAVRRPKPRVRERSAGGLYIRDVEWTPVLIGFLTFVFAIVTYYLPVGVIGMLIGILGLGLQRYPIRAASTLYWFGAFVLWSVITAALSPYPDAIGDAVADLAKVWVIAFVGYNALRTRRQIQFFMVFVVAMYTLFPVRGTFISFFIAGYNVFGRALWNYIYNNPNDLAALTLLQLGLAAAIFVSEPRRLIRICAGIAMALFPILILMTQSRGGMLALGVFVLLSLSGQRRKLRAMTYIATLTVIVVLLAPGDVWERVSGIVSVRSTTELTEADPEQSAATRWDILTIATRIVRAHPLTGVGLGAYPVANAEFARGQDVLPGARRNADTHNTYLNIAAETGFPGLILMLGLLISVFLRAERARKRWKARAPGDASALRFLELGLLAFLVAGIFGSFAKLSHLYIYISLMLAFTERRRFNTHAALGVPARQVQRYFRERRAAYRGNDTSAPAARMRVPADTRSLGYSD